MKLLLERYEDYQQTFAGVTPWHVFAHFIKPIPSKLFKSNDFQELLRIGSLIPGIGNNLQSTQKKERVWNFVTLQQKPGGHSVDDAI